MIPRETHDDRLVMPPGTWESRDGVSVQWIQKISFGKRKFRAQMVVVTQ